MMKLLFLPLWALTSLQAKGIDPDDMSEIYTEAILFVAVFGLLSIISFIVSRKHAKQYAEKGISSKQDEPEAPKETTETIPADHAETAETAENEVDKLIELSKMLKEGLITEEEFQLFKKKLIS